MALAQAHDVKARLLAAHADLNDDDVAISVIKTTGDAILDRSLMAAGGKGLFTKEIEDALLRGSIDLAVHSCKDMPTRLPDGLELSAYLPREDARDVFLSPHADRFDDLAEGAVLGTASLRRRAQALRARPDLKVITFRGNVQTRLKKLHAGEADATFLARAGLNRLGQSELPHDVLDQDRFLTAPAQGVVVIESRIEDSRVSERIRPLDDAQSRVAALTERAFLASLDGSCRTPIAANAEVRGATVHLKGAVYSVDGQTCFAGDWSGTLDAAQEGGHSLGTSLRAEAGTAFFEQLKRDAEALA